ncbi:MAG: bifunctional demethylmenaquinone methyltransferase/2-methoxy-6-polyprenyl-1,4-benzoquinol methylase UbiE [Pseudomonadota bacterium]
MPEHQKSGSPAVRKMFSSISGKYDLLNRLLSMGTDIRWRRELSSEVPDTGEAPVLDIATGTADVALAIEKHCPGDSLIVGIDFTIPMLKVGAEKVARTGRGRIKLTAGDAYSLPFKDSVFGAATIAFGLRNLSHRTDGLREMARVLVPGGRVVILEFSPMNKLVIGGFFRFYFHRVMPVIGGIISGNRHAYVYLPESVDQFPDPVQLGREMMEAGFTDVKYRALTFGIAYIHVGEKTVERGA